MKLRLVITMDNAAFESSNPEHTSRFREGGEVARILRGLAHKVDNGVVERGDRWPLVDWNGNTVGEAKVTR